MTLFPHNLSPHNRPPIGRYLEGLYHSDVKSKEDALSAGSGGASAKGRKRSGDSEDNDAVSERFQAFPSLYHLLQSSYVIFIFILHF